MKTSRSAWGWLAIGAALTASHLVISRQQPEAPVSAATKPANAGNRPPRSSDPREAVLRAAARDGMRDLADQLVAWTASDPAAAADWACAWIRESPLKSEARAAALASELSRMGQAGIAMDIALRLGDSLGEETLSLALSIEAATDPLAAWKRTEGLAEGPLRDLSRKLILNHGTDVFLPELAELAAGLPGDDGRTLGGILKRWSLQDPAALSEWLNSHRIPQSSRDQAAALLVLQGDSENRSTDVAAAWAESIGRPALRFDAMQAAATEMARADPAAARHYVSKSPKLSDAEKDKIITTLDSGR
jgi:hypothetical protein